MSTSAFEPVTLYEYKAYLFNWRTDPDTGLVEQVPINVVDGDTVDLIIDYGRRITQQDRFRLYGINTPERGQSGYQEATDFVKDRLHSMAKDLRVRTHLDKQDKYGRVLAEIYYHTPDGIWHDLNQELIVAGLAVAYYP
jgi:micrococcal nuclease